jgi:PAS domain S-box-containing protein
MTRQNVNNKTCEQLQGENEQLRAQLDDAEQTLDAIRNGDVDALVVAGPHGDQIFSLSGSERIYRQIVETMNEGAMTVGLDGTITFCNQRLCSMLRYPMDEIIGRNYTSFSIPAQRSQLKQFLYDTQAGPMQQYFRLEAVDGADVPVNIAASMLLTDNDSSICLVVSDLTALEVQSSSIADLLKHNNVMELQQTELHASNDELRDAQHAALNLIEDIEAARVMTDEVNKELLHEIKVRKQAEEALRNIQAELESRIEERTADLATAVEVLEVEVHERQTAELNLKRLNLLYAVLSETNQTIVNISDRDSLFNDFCRIAVEHGGFVLSWIGLVDGQSGKVNIVASSGATGYLNDVKITANNEPEGEGPTGMVIRGGSYYICNDFQNDPCTRPWHDQSKKYGIHASASIAIKENDQVIGALTLYADEKDYFDVQQVELLLQMGLDISFALDNLNRETSRKEAEKALYEETSERLKAVEILREKEQMLIQQSRQAAMGEMIGNIAHQWRQPLNTLGLHAQKLGVFYGSPSFNKELLDNSIAKTMEIIKHMSKTIDDFRNYFKPGKEKVDFKVIEAIKNTLSLLEGNFNNPKITIDFVEQSNPVINGYQNEFAQVFLNILNNARDAMIERETAEPRIIITICNENGCAVVTVADNAGGIPVEAINKVFDPYFTTKGPQQGTGIGLFMSKTIIEKNMGGKLTVRNTDIGAEFRIEVKHGSQS